MTVAESGIPPFEYLLGGYFHQDWDLTAPNGAAILDTFSQENPLEEVLGPRDAAAEFLTRHLSEDQLTAELHQAGLDYAPDYEGMTHHQWLELVVERLTYWIDRRERCSAG